MKTRWGTGSSSHSSSSSRRRGSLFLPGGGEGPRKEHFCIYCVTIGYLRTLFSVMAAVRTKVTPSTKLLRTIINTIIISFVIIINTIVFCDGCSEYQSFTVHQAARNLWKPSLFVDIHTGMESIMMPWGHKVTLSDIPNNVISAWDAWIAAMNRRAITGALVAASPGSSQLYLTPGSVENTFYGTFGAKYSMTIETFSAVAEGEGFVFSDVAAATCVLLAFAMYFGGALISTSCSAVP